MTKILEALSYLRNEEVDNKDELCHFGILGQKWGKKNGPPYPLSKEKHKKVVKSKQTYESARGEAKKLSDDDLDLSIERLRREKEYAYLVSDGEHKKPSKAVKIAAAAGTAAGGIAYYIARDTLRTLAKNLIFKSGSNPNKSINSIKKSFSPKEINLKSVNRLKKNQAKGYGTKSLLNSATKIKMVDLSGASMGTTLKDANKSIYQKAITQVPFESIYKL